MTKDEALRLALEALKQIDEAMPFPVAKLAQKVIKEALAQPEFIKHEVKNADDWSEWVCPDPKNYLMKCCDCGLVHEAQFGVVRYKSETERDDCDMVDDPNLQAVFRMRRSEEWTPEDTAHRSGGLPMAQQAQEPVAHSVVAGALFDFMGWLTSREKRLILSSVDEASPAVEAITEFAKKRNLSLKYAEVGYWMEFLSTPSHQEAKDEPVGTAGELFSNTALERLDLRPSTNIYITPLPVAEPYKRKPLTDEEIGAIMEDLNAYGTRLYTFARAIEVAHGIKG